MDFLTGKALSRRTLLKGVGGALKGGFTAAREAMPALGARLGRAYEGAAGQAMRQGDRRRIAGRGR